MSTGESAPDIEALSALRTYQKGMRNLGRTLASLAALQFAIEVTLLAMTFDPPLLLVRSGMALVSLALALTFVGGRRWANHLVIGWSVLLLVSNGVRIAGLAEQPPGGSPGVYLGLVIAAALLHYAARNLSAARRAAAAGLDIGSAPWKVGYGLPVMASLRAESWRRSARSTKS